MGMGEQSCEPELHEGGEAWPYEVDAGDHFETPLAAYEDVVPLLRLAARRRAKARGLPLADCEAQLRIYDPYFCSGRMKELLQGLGYQKVVHRRRDFYQDIADGTVPGFHLLLTNPPYSGDHKERLLKWLLERQRASLQAGDNSQEPFLLLLPSWTVGKAFFRTFLAELGRLRACYGSGATSGEENAGVFYVCRRGARGGPEKYSFDHVGGAGLSQCPFFGLWICGGFGSPRQTFCAARLVARKNVEAFWQPDSTWHPCCVSLKEEHADEEDVVWEDGTWSSLPRSLLRGGRLVSLSVKSLEAIGLLRSAEDVKRRQDQNPRQKARLEVARQALLRKRQAAKEAHCGGKRPRPDRRQYVRFEADASSGAAAEQVAEDIAGAFEVPANVCRHFFSARGCSTGRKCRFAHELPK